MSDNFLIDEPVEGVRRITFNRPEAMNAFTFPMYQELLDLLGEIKFDPRVRVVILTATGRGFCTGHDLKAGGAPDWVPEGLGKAYNSRYSMSVIASIPVAIRNLPQPVICGINGTVAGMAMGFTLAADISVAASSAKFVNSIHNAGSGAELGVSYMLPRAVGVQRAAEMLLTARPVLADEAERIGLVLKTVPDEELQDACLAIARNIVVNVPMGIWVTKQSLWANQNAGSLEQAIEFESRGVFIAQSMEDKTEKQKSFFEKRPPVFSFK
ncbi:enoyl-CoA hydratase-related protein [Sphingomonas sp. MG17]|uniref:Enoyl-CoA hydratase-related protein n=1 Tax=Sphingomonas tagetis TaxID=2949092 RepID=A0A9X2KL63_9SPHN|nr:enoyl-CoA hydratase-related protein [Sphingomonas tagetis]MCP3731244.1 enoyl-CoA hydratase-related protein [Sphingomonas tagetis]